MNMIFNDNFEKYRYIATEQIGLEVPIAELYDYYIKVIQLYVLMTKLYLIIHFISYMIKSLT